MISRTPDVMIALSTFYILPDNELCECIWHKLKYKRYDTHAIQARQHASVCTLSFLRNSVKTKCTLVSSHAVLKQNVCLFPHMQR